MHTATQFPLIMIFHHLLPPTPDPWQNMKTAPNLKLCHIALFIFYWILSTYMETIEERGKLVCASDSDVLKMKMCWKWIVLKLFHQLSAKGGQIRDCEIYQTLRYYYYIYYTYEIWVGPLPVNIKWPVLGNGKKGFGVGPTFKDS